EYVSDHKSTEEYPTWRIFLSYYDVFGDEIPFQHKQRPFRKNAPSDTWYSDEFLSCPRAMTRYDETTSCEHIDYNEIAAFIHNYGHSIKELFNLCDNSISTVCVFGSTLIRRIPK
ncbi:hypothetical protein MAR_002107, partial [Mya arenaria]